MEFDALALPRDQIDLTAWNNIEETVGGHYFIGGTEDICVRELDRTGRVVWRSPPLMPAGHAVRLHNGNTVLAAGDRVAEVDRGGKVVWEAVAKGACGACESA